MTRRTQILFVLVASASALIATSKEVASAGSSSVIVEEPLALDADESVTYRIEVEHGLAADASASMLVDVSASVFAAQEDTTLSMRFSDENDDTGSFGLSQISEVLVSGTLVPGSETYGVDAVPLLTLTAGDDAISGTVEVEVTVTLDSGSDTGKQIGALSAALVAVE